MGLSERSIVEDETSLKRQIEHLVEVYRQPILVEEYIEGREFTVGILEDGDARVLPIVEVVFDGPRGLVLFNPDESVIPLIRQVRGDGVPLPTAHHHAVCPAEIDEALAREIERTALKAFKALGCRDWCRMEMRRAEDGTLYVLELNPIAGIDPSYWLPKAAEVAGLGYEGLVNAILGQALARAGL
jgi:D-alanine-D-alanine ligase